MMRDEFFLFFSPPNVENKSEKIMKLAEALILRAVKSNLNN
jgi:hypothetical protein